MEPPFAQHRQHGATTLGGVNSLIADGHVQFIKNTINVVVWQGLGSRNGGEVISSDAY